jgi:hypothetical protein
VAQLRDGLAARILQTFPHFAADLPSGRFWPRRSFSSVDRSAGT